MVIENAHHNSQIWKFDMDSNGSANNLEDLTEHLHLLFYELCNITYNTIDDVTKRSNMKITHQTKGVLINWIMSHNDHGGRHLSAAIECENLDLGKNIEILHKRKNQVWRVLNIWSWKVVKFQHNKLQFTLLINPMNNNHRVIWSHITRVD